MEQSERYRNCWVMGAIAGVVVLLFTAGIGDLDWAGGLFLGFVTFLLLGATLVWMIRDDRPEPVATDAGMTVADWERDVADRQPAALLASGSLGPEQPTSLTQLPIVAGAMRRSAGEKPEPVEAVSVVVAEVEPIPEPAAAPVATAATEQADDLKRINGIGPKLSEWLAENGVTRFEQIAAWDAEAQAEYARRLGRRGRRIASDDWVGQAKLLAAGGETAHSRAVDRGEST